MRHLKSGRKLSRRKHHREAMLTNLAISLIEKSRIKTTDIKAKELRPFIERMVTFARRGDLHARRVVLARLKNAAAVKKLFNEIGQQFANRNGGYTRIIKLGFRHGDNSPISLIEFVKEDEDKKLEKKRKSSKTQAKTKSLEGHEKITETVEAEVEEVAEEKVEETIVKKPEDSAEGKTTKAIEKVEEKATEESLSNSEAKVDSGKKADNSEEPTDEKEDSGDEENK